MRFNCLVGMVKADKPVEPVIKGCVLQAQLVRHCTDIARVIQRVEIRAAQSARFRRGAHGENIQPGIVRAAIRLRVEVAIRSNISQVAQRGLIIILDREAGLIKRVEELTIV